MKRKDLLLQLLIELQLETHRWAYQLDPPSKIARARAKMFYQQLGDIIKTLKGKV